MQKEKDLEQGLYEKLKEYSQSDYYGFHMPGHKRLQGEFVNPFSIDITEIEEFDDLHHPEADGILTELQKRSARIYHSEETHFLVNGSTGGILSAISACTRRGGKILAARNCHRSVYHGIMLRDLQAVYIYPQQEENLGINGSILPEDVEKILEEHPDIQAVVLTSPTYDGICSDIRRIGQIVHQRKIPLIVDQAHGAHFPFHPDFPEDAVSQGADVVIHSVHKTLPSLTQTALLHVNGDLVDRDRLQMFLSVYQTSSPSYVLMASIDSCMEFLEKMGREPFDRQMELLRDFYAKCEEFHKIRLMDRNVCDGRGIWDLDASKLLFSVLGTGWTGRQLGYRLWKDFHIQMEMNTCTYSLGISTAADTAEGMERLWKALSTLDAEIEKDIHSRKRDLTEQTELLRLPRPEQEMTMGCAQELPKETVREADSCGRTAGSFVYLYPPGIPLLAPGERITEEILERISFWRQHGMEVHGTGADGTICVLREV